MGLRVLFELAAGADAGGTSEFEGEYGEAVVCRGGDERGILWVLAWGVVRGEGGGGGGCGVFEWVEGKEV